MKTTELHSSVVYSLYKLIRSLLIYIWKQIELLGC
nr:MAG TPA: hypothetical protein [Caudoviricetes sp.]